MVKTDEIHLMASSAQHVSLLSAWQMKGIWLPEDLQSLSPYPYLLTRMNTNQMQEESRSLGEEAWSR